MLALGGLVRVTQHRLAERGTLVQPTACIHSQSSTIPWTLRDSAAFGCSLLPYLAPHHRLPRYQQTQLRIWTRASCFSRAEDPIDGLGVALVTPFFELEVACLTQKAVLVQGQQDPNVAVVCALDPTYRQVYMA